MLVCLFYSILIPLSRESNGSGIFWMSPHQLGTVVTDFSVAFFDILLILTSLTLTSIMDGC